MFIRLAVLSSLAAGCGGGGGGGSAPAAPAVIDADNAAIITQEVIDAGLGASAFGVAVGGGGILAADGGNAETMGLRGQRKLIQRAQADVVIPAEDFDCLESGSVRLSGSIANFDTLTQGDRLNAQFSHCDDAEGFVFHGGLRIDVDAFSGDFFGDQYLLGATVTLTDLSLTEDGETITGDGSFDLDLDLTEPQLSDLTVSGALLRYWSGNADWVLRDFAVTVIENSSGVELITQYSGTGTLEGAAFEGAVDFVTVSPLVATGDQHPATGEILITGANGATIRATVENATTISLAIDLDGDTVVDETREMPWSAAGGLGLVVYRMVSPPPTPVPAP